MNTPIFPFFSYWDEEWRPAPGLPDYWVSSLGRVASTTKRKPFVMSPALQPNGYVKVFLAGKNYWVHRLVCEAFHGPAPAPNLHAAHLDGRPSNNFATNLQWKTGRENAQDKRAHGTHLEGARAGSAKLTEAQVEALRISPRLAVEEAALLGVSVGTIQRIRRGARWAHLGPQVRPSDTVGERHMNAILTADKVRKMRERFAAGFTNVAVGVEFGVHTNTARAVRLGKTWKHVA